MRRAGEWRVGTGRSGSWAGAAWGKSTRRIHREVGDRRSEGIALGNLGVLHLEQGRMEEAREALARGEAILPDQDDRVELGKFLCTRAELEDRSDDVT